jgi:hypothetical protein
LTTDPSQARLWQEAIAKNTVRGLDRAEIANMPVAQIKPLRIRDRPSASIRQPLPATVPSALIIVNEPQLEQPFSGTARIVGVLGEFLTVELAPQQVLELQVKVQGGPLRTRAGETFPAYFRQGDPVRRDDILAMKLSQDDLIYALVGGRGPVRIVVPVYNMTANQTGSAKQNVLGVEVSIGGETRTMQQGEEAQFRASGLTVKVLASIAAQGQSINVLPEPNRLEILAWRTR